MNMLWHTCGSQRTTCRCLSVFPSTTCVLGIKLKPSSLVPKCLYLLSHLKGSLKDDFLKWKEKEEEEEEEDDEDMLKIKELLAPLGLDIPVLRRRKQRNKKAAWVHSETFFQKKTKHES